MRAAAMIAVVFAQGVAACSSTDPVESLDDAGGPAASGDTGDDALASEEDDAGERPVDELSPVPAPDLDAPNLEAGTGAQGIVLGPILGAPTDRSIKVWMRSDGPSYVVRAWPLASPELAREWTMPEPEIERDLATVVTLTDLVQGARYAYEVLTDDRVRVAGGTFRPLPPHDAPATIRFATAADVLDGDVPGFRDIAAADPDFVLLVGDNAYADGSGSTIEVYRRRYERIWSGPDFRALFSEVPVAMIWDDHELVDNYWEGKNDDVYAFARPLYEIYQGMHNPDPLVTGTLYYTFAVGRVGFFVLDTRSHRSDNALPDGPEKSMLGTVQKEALLDWLADDPSDVHVVVSSVLMHRATTTGADSWQSFATERAEVLEAIASTDARNVLVLSGDQHWSAVLRLTTAGADPYDVYEFQATPLDFTLRGAPRDLDDTIIGLDNSRRVYGIFDIDTSVEPPKVVYTLCAVGLACDLHDEPAPPVGRAAVVPYTVSFTGGPRGLQLEPTGAP